MYYFDDIVNINDLNDNILFDEKSHKIILAFHATCKTP